MTPSNFEQGNLYKEPIRTVGGWAKGTLQEMQKSLKKIFIDDPKQNAQRSKGVVGKLADVTGGGVMSVVSESINFPLRTITGISMSVAKSTATLLGDVVVITGRAAANNLRIIPMVGGNRTITEARDDVRARLRQNRPNTPETPPREPTA